MKSATGADRPFVAEDPPRTAATERVMTGTRPAVVGNSNGQVVTMIDPGKLGFKTAGTDTRFCKFGFYGAQGSGKTTTATWLAREIARREGKKSVYMIDSEGGSDFVASVLEKAGMRLEVIKTREFKRLVQVTEALHDSGEVLILDSVTHFWNDVIESFLAQKSGYKALEMKDFSTLYDTWRLFTKPYVTSKLHYLVCARMGWEYATTVNERGKLEFYKSDTKFKAGEQFGHEPALLIYMQQIDNAEAVERLHHAKDKAEKAKAAEQMAIGSSLDFVATVEKDRARLLMGRQLVFTPTPDDEANARAVVTAFDPVIAWHLKNATHSGLEAGGGTGSLFPSQEDDRAYFERRKRKEIVLGEIEATFTRWLPSTSPKDRQAAVIVAEKVFGVKSWEAVKQMELEVLEAVIAPQPDGPSVLERACIQEREKIDAGAKPAAKTGPTALPEA